MRQTLKTVQFANSFTLKGLDGAVPSGTYEVVTTEALIPSLWFEAWQRTETQIRMPAIEHTAGQTQLVTINPQELDDALMSDLGPGPVARHNHIRD